MSIINELRIYESHEVNEIKHVMNKFKKLAKEKKRELLDIDDQYHSIYLRFQGEIIEDDLNLFNYNEVTTQEEDYNMKCSKLINTANELHEENVKLLQQIKKIKKLKLTFHDINLIERGNQTLELYKCLSGIRWDYKSIDECIKGVITNKDNYIHLFKFSKHEKHIEDKIWHEISKSVEDLYTNLRKKQDSNKSCTEKDVIEMET